jgi:transcriptional regulator with XRE-family HTH domain
MDRIAMATPTEPNIAEIAMRIGDMREMTGRSVEDMANITGVTPEHYKELESGKFDFSFTFLYKCAKAFGVDIIEIITGESPHLTECSMVPAGNGLPIKRRVGFEYNHLAPFFKDKLAEPFLVLAKYHDDNLEKPIPLSTHKGQEFNYVLSGTMRFIHEDHVMDLKAGDTVFYDSNKGHGMVATSKEGCLFISVVINDPRGEPQ